jgi:hypothetical protein
MCQHFNCNLSLYQNFMSTIMEAQYGRLLELQDGSSTLLGAMVDRLNLFFTAYFALELILNAYAHWIRDFISSGWNHLDVFIVMMSLIDLSPEGILIPDWFVKLVRALRVIRLFGRISALKKMAAAVTASIFPMMNAFVILLIVLSICELPTSASSPCNIHCRNMMQSSPTRPPSFRSSPHWPSYQPFVKVCFPLPAATQSLTV